MNSEHPGGAVLTGEQINAISRFPDANPNPVLRLDADGHLIYANPASTGVRAALTADVGDQVSPDDLRRLRAAADGGTFIEVAANDRTYEVWPVEVTDLDVMNLYGVDVTAERAIVKFPDQNPNPVLRIDRTGLVVYANPASEGLLAGLGHHVGDRLVDELRAALLDSADAGERTPVDVTAAGRGYSLLPVDVPEFGFINVYGTDITARLESERLALENERLLLNVLPVPIADRLRAGEPVIADRFDDVTLLFADIVEFTRMSSTMSPDALVGVLNEVFSAFDALVDRHGLEKVKTIGDAYMVVGGLPDPTPDHTVRMAAMALEMAGTVERLGTCARLGVSFRIGIHCGPVVAGVIGVRKFIYDVWGDTVNLASRMESHGVPGRVQVTEAVHDRLREDFELEARGLIDIKGKGLLPTWFLVG